MAWYLCRKSVKYRKNITLTIHPCHCFSDGTKIPFQDFMKAIFHPSSSQTPWKSSTIIQTISRNCSGELHKDNITTARNILLGLCSASDWKLRVWQKAAGEAGCGKTLSLCCIIYGLFFFSIIYNSKLFKLLIQVFFNTFICIICILNSNQFI